MQNQDLWRGNKKPTQTRTMLATLNKSLSLFMVSIDRPCQRRAGFLFGGLLAFWVTVMVIGVMFWLFIFLTFAPMVKYVFADQINLEVIAQIESNNNPNAIGKAGEIGTFQIMPCVLVEYNRYNASNFNRNALFCHELNKNVATWYMTVRVPQMLKYYGIPVTTENVIYAWNCGIGNVVKGRIPKSTKAYMAKYSKLTGGK